MKNKLRERLKNIAHGKLEPAAKLFFDIIAWLERVYKLPKDAKEIC